MTENDVPVIEDFLEHTDTTAGPPPTPFPTIGLARTVADLCQAYRRLPVGALFMVVRTMRRSDTPVGRTPRPVPRVMITVLLAVKPNDAEPFGDGGVSFPVAQRGECEQNHVSVIRGPITIGVGELAQTTEVVFGEDGIYDWLSKDHNDTTVVSWLDSKQTAAVRFFRTADAINCAFKPNGNLDKLRSYVGELIGQKIQILSNLARMKPSTPEIIEWARRLVLDLRKLGRNDQIISEGLKKVREIETAEFLRLVNAPPR